MRAVVDRFEGDYAVLIMEDTKEKIDLPAPLLPEGAKEGSWLKLSFELDEEETEKRKKRVKEKMDKLKRKKE